MADHYGVMKNTELDENEIRRIAAEIEQKYIDLPDDVWHKITHILASRANT